jgi:hypothetical protein
LKEHPHAQARRASSGAPDAQEDVGRPASADAAGLVGEASVGSPGDVGPPQDGSPTTTSDGPPVPSEGVGVMINGTKVPREKVIVLIHIGHSDMAGRAQGPADLKPAFFDTYPQLWQYQKGGVWNPAKEPLCGDGGTPGHPQGAGPGMALLHRALVASPEAYVVSIGKGASLDFAATCFSFRKGGLYYDSVMGPALELKGRVTFGGVFTMLGYDARTNPKAQNGGYIACLESLAADFRAELGEPNLPFVVGDYERGATGTWSPSCCGAPQVIAQLAQVPARIPRSFLIPTDGLPMQDDHHFNLTGHQMWADRAFMGMASKGLLPWATAK